MAVTITAASLLAGIFVFTVCLLIPFHHLESWANKRLNVDFRKIRATNPGCLAYLQDYTAKPIWRIALLSSLKISFLVLVFMILFWKGKQLRTVLMTYLVLLLAGFFVIYKALAHEQWHGLCDYSCSPKRFDGGWKGTKHTWPVIKLLGGTGVVILLILVVLVSSQK